MFAYRLSPQSDELDDSTPLRELTFYDLLEPPTPSKEQPERLADPDEDADDDEEFEEGDEQFANTSKNSLNTPRVKKNSSIQILENKRITAPIGPALRNVLSSPIRVMTTPPKAAQVTDVKILNKLTTQPMKTFASTPVRIGSTTIGTTLGPTSVTAVGTKNIGGLPLTQIKTPDGKVIYLQKSVSVAGASGAKAPASGTPARIITQSTAGGIRQTVLPKGVTISSTGLIKSNASNVQIAVKGLTTVSATKPATVTTATAAASTSSTAAAAAAAPTSSSSSTPTGNKLPINVVRTADGKYIKFNPSGGPVLLNAGVKPTKVAVRPPGSMATLLNSNNSVSSSNVVIKKPTAQVIIKTPLKQLPAGASLRPVIAGSTTTTTATPTSTTSSSSSTATTTTATTSAKPTTTTTAKSSLAAGTILVQSSTGKHIVVSTKNIIKLAPKSGTSTATTQQTTTTTTTAAAAATPTTTATTTATKTTTAVASGAASGLHAIQLPGKTGVQYVRVLPKGAVSSQKVPLERLRTSSSTTNNNTTTTTTTTSSSSGSGSSSSTSATVSVPSTSKIVMKTTGGSIVPLPSMQTLVPRRSLGGLTAAQFKVIGKGSGSGSGINTASLEAARKHRLSDVNVQMKTLSGGDGGNSSDAGVSPEGKKARYVIAMPQSTPPAGSSGTGGGQKLVKVSRPVQRVLGPAASSAGAPPTRNIYNLVKKNEGNNVKFMICSKTSEGKPRTFINNTMRRGYTLAESNRHRRPMITLQQHRFRQMRLQQQKQQMAQAQAKQRQHQTDQANQAKNPTGTGKTLFDILKATPPPVPIALPQEPMMVSRRKHCNCSKSQCLKLYCDCFANGEFCQDCTCKDCFNNLDYEVKREHAIRNCLERNPSAFKPKITAPNSGDMRLHNKGCNCKRSGCLKNYCECYEAKIPCTSICKCVGCRNMEDRPDVDMDSMENMLEMKAIKRTESSNVAGSSKEHRSNVYLTDEVIEATISCLMTRIAMHEKQRMSLAETEMGVIEELGESLKEIMNYAKEKNETIAKRDDAKTTA